MDQTKRFETALATRNFEIGLFWNRSLFFWGFIAAAFVAYATLRDIGSDMSLLLACFGLVCSVCWALVNRGSKFWQEAWEAKLEEVETSVTGPLFQEPAREQRKGCWLSGRRYSVSKVTIALSDYTVFLWAAIVAWDALTFLTSGDSHVVMKAMGYVTFLMVSLSFIAFTLWAGRSSTRPR